MSKPTLACPLPTAKPSQLPSGTWGLRIRVAGVSLRLPLGGADATPAEVAKAHRAVLAQWPAIVARVEAEQATEKAAKRTGPTFADVAGDWTSGKLAKLYPDHVKTKRSAADDAYRLAAHILPYVGDVAISSFTIQDAELVMSKLSTDLSTASRRHVAQLMVRVLSLSVYPLRLREASPLPRGFLPKLGARVGLSWLYPDEDAQLLGCARVPFVWRLLFGVLTREGMRLGEAASLRWTDLDLERGTIRLDVNKTDEPRFWPLGADVVAALAAWRKVNASEYVFVTDDGAQLNVGHASTMLQGFLREAGLTRAELSERTATRRPLRVHDLRASFCTIALAIGKSETWVRDRTGHTTGIMLERYRRTARHASELGLQWFTRLDKALNSCNDRCNEGSDGGPNMSTHVDENTTKEALCTRGELNPYALRRRNLNAAGEFSIVVSAESATSDSLLGPLGTLNIATDVATDSGPDGPPMDAYEWAAGISRSMRSVVLS